MKTKAPLVILLAAIPCSTLLQAQNAPNPPAGMATLIREQRQLGGSLDQIRQRVAAILTSLENLGATAEEVKVYRSAVAVLGKLSEDEVLQIVSILEEAARESGGNSAKEITAFGKQQGIILKLQSVLLSIQRKGEAANVANEVQKTSEAQAALMKETRKIAPDSPQSAKDLAKAEQKNISAQIAAAQQALQNLPKGNDPVAERARAEAQRQLATASQLAQNLPEAIGKAPAEAVAQQQAQIQQTLREAADTLKQTSLADKLAQAKNNLDHTTAAQKSLAGETAKADADKSGKKPGEKAGEKTSEKPGEKSADKPGEKAPNDPAKNTAEAARQQAELADQAASSKQELQKLAPEAAKDIEEAAKKMEEAKKKLESGDRQAAAKEQEKAAEKLESASEKLEEKLNKALAEEAKMEDGNTAAAQALIERLKAIVQSQHTLNKTHDKVKQAELAASCELLQPETAQISVPAGELVGRASECMKTFRGVDAILQLNRAISLLEVEKETAAKKKADQEAAKQAAAQAEAASDKLSEASKSLEKNDPKATEQLAQAAKAMEAIAQQAGQNLSPDQQQALAEAHKNTQAAMPDAAQKRPDAAQTKIAAAQAQLEQVKANAELAQQDLPRSDETRLAQNNQAPQNPADQKKPDQPTGEPQSKDKPYQFSKGDHVDKDFLGASMQDKGFETSDVGALKPKEREAVLQARSEAVSEEYSSQVEAYFRTIAGGSTPAK